MQLKFKYQPAPGLQPVVSSQNSMLKWISLNVLQLAVGRSYHGNSENEEQALVFMTGTGNVRIAGEILENIGGRKSVFQGAAHTLYVPPRTEYDITAIGGALEVAVAGAVSDRRGQPALITPNMTRYEQRGAWHWERHIYDSISTVNPVSQRLYIIEVYTPPGHWSSVPPHKHDRDNPPYESDCEEIYFYKMKPEQGFGFQRIYSDDGSLDEAIVVEHNCATIQPQGYHPVANHPGYQMYYLNIIAGEKRSLIPYDDPKHAWVKDIEPTLRDKPF